ncbi:MAG: OFA family MFS transporter [Bacteroidales bacterium]|jgi:OFA family oxalate/formate antiporter-like MFS transporter|nr:OFA family MFS transporter [Bacteroidales bacterium]
MSNENLESKRWVIAIAAIIMQLSLGTVYAWSVFKKVLMKDPWGWGETPVQVTFMICIGMIGIAAAFGGTLVDKKGPRFVATLGGILFGVGTIVGGIGIHIESLPLLYFGYGFLGGLGNGFGYVTPIATLIRWFPDKRGLVTGLAVMGFGAGAFFMGKIAPMNIASMGPAVTLYMWGAIFLVLVTGAAQFFKNPPEGWLPAGFTPPVTASGKAVESFEFKEARKTPQWWILWFMLFFNVTAGIGLISQMSPIGQTLFGPLVDKTLSPEKLAIVIAAAGGSVIAYASIFNGLGRLIWAWISDAIGRKAVFSIMFLTQAVLYVLIASGIISGYYVFIVVACYLLACYGGGFATMPAFAADSFGPKYIGKVYGMMLTAWGAAGVVGPLIFSKVKEATGSFSVALYIAAALLGLGFILSVLYKNPAHKNA